MRLIDADALKKEAYASSEWNGETQLFDLPVVDITDIDSAPTVDAEPVRHGYWIPEEDETMRCSNCEETYEFDAFFYFCPNCGCQMGEKRKFKVV